MVVTVSTMRRRSPPMSASLAGTGTDAIESAGVTSKGEIQQGIVRAQQPQLPLMRNIQV